MTNSVAQHYDILVIGGGINGCGIARDAAGRGYSVCLAEMGDLASGTSSASTKLIHGGLRYLEHYEFRLVREALAEREVLLRAAPHIIRPMRFVLPHAPGMRPRWLLRLGLLLYDHLAGRRLLPPTRALNLRDDPAGAPLRAGLTAAFEYSDCWVDDARLVVLNAVDAAARGATVLSRTRVEEARASGGGWTATIAGADGSSREVSARLIVNAAGARVGDVAERILGLSQPSPIRLVQGSHIIVPSMFSHGRAYIFQNPDGRIFFAIPYEGDYTLIGTTDRDYRGDPADVRITAQETDYLLEAIGRNFSVPVAAEDIVGSYSGLRPLYDDSAGHAHKATRDYILRTAAGPGGSPAVNVFGGKITTYRRLAEEALSIAGASIGALGHPWTAQAALPGGDFPISAAADLAAALRAGHLFLAEQHAERLVRLYGTRAADTLGGASSPDGLGEHFGSDLYEAEVRFLVQREWAQTAEDVLWRRTKCGLRLTASQAQRLAQFMDGPEGKASAAG